LNQRFFSIVGKHLGGSALSTYTILIVLFSAKNKKQHYYAKCSIQIKAFSSVQVMVVLWVLAVCSD
jgi:hypothetical protein